MPRCVTTGWVRLGKHKSADWLPPIQQDAPLNEPWAIHLFLHFICKSCCYGNRIPEPGVLKLLFFFFIQPVFNRQQKRVLTFSFFFPDFLNTNDRDIYLKTGLNMKSPFFWAVTQHRIVFDVCVNVHQWHNNKNSQLDATIIILLIISISSISFGR